MCWIGAVGSSDSMLPTTGLTGGRGIGLNLLGDAIAVVSPAVSLNTRRHLRRALATKQSIPCCGWMDCFASLAMTVLSKSPSTPIDQFRADLFRLFLLRPMAAVPD